MWCMIRSCPDVRLHRDEGCMANELRSVLAIDLQEIMAAVSGALSTRDLDRSEVEVLSGIQDDLREMATGLRHESGSDSTVPAPFIDERLASWAAMGADSRPTSGGARGDGSGAAPWLRLASVLSDRCLAARFANKQGEVAAFLVVLRDALIGVADRADQRAKEQFDALVRGSACSYEP